MEEELTMTQAQILDSRDLKRQAPPIPILMRAALILLALNAVIALWIYFSPTLITSKPAGANTQVYTGVSSKQSPFEMLLADKPRKGARLPEKLTPVFAETITFEPSPAVIGDN
jgi:hypothetical protein